MARIRESSSKLSSGQRRVVDFLLTQPDQAVFLTTTQIAHQLSVSEATVVRAARTLRFSGYPELRAAFRSYFVERMSTVTRVRLTARPRRSDSEIIDEVISTDSANLEATRVKLDYKALSQAADLIGSARNVYVIGLRAAHCVAWLLHFSLTLALSNSRLITLGLADVPEQLEHVGSPDVAVGITFERYNRYTVELFRACLAKGARGIALTDKATSPLVEGATVSLEAQTRLSSFIDSYVAPMSMVNALVTLIAAKRRRKVIAALRQREEDWRHHRIYL